MQVLERNVKTIPLLLSKVYFDTLDATTSLMKVAGTLDWLRLQEKCISGLAKGNENMRYFISLSNKVKSTNELLDRFRGIAWLSRAVRANELLLRDSITFLFEAEVQLNKIKYAEKRVRANQTNSFEKGQQALLKSRAYLKRQQLELYLLTLQRKPEGEIVEKCLTCSNNLQGLISQLAEAQVYLYCAVKQYKSERPTKILEKIGTLSCQFNQLTREVTASYLSTHYLMFSILGVKLRKDLSLVKTPYFMPFDTRVPNGKDVSITALAKEKAEKFVEVSGFVQAVERIEKANKMAMKVVLEDIKGNKSIPILFSFSNPTAYGIVPGAYCNINGFVKDNHKLTATKAVEVDKLSMKTELSQAWRFAFIQLCAPLYYAYPQNLNVSWSLVTT